MPASQDDPAGVLPPGTGPAPDAPAPGAPAADAVEPAKTGRAGFLRLAYWLPAVGIVIVFGAIAFAMFKPSELDMSANGVAESWNESIAKLGILPVFPPEEDMNVGDLWAVVAEADEKPLLGRGVRVGHIDLREDMAKEQKRHPVFKKTALVEGEKPFRDQDESEDSGLDEASRIRVSLVAFPGLKVVRAADLRTGAQSPWGWLGLGRQQVDVEELHIPVAETYGPSATVAAGRLDLWCSQKSNEIFCSDSYLRKIVALTVGDVVLATRDGGYPVKLKLQLVYRVFMTRKIDHRRGRDHGDGLRATQGAPQPIRSSTAAAGVEPANSAEGARAALRQAEIVAPGGKEAGVDGAYAQTSASAITLTEVFRRPLVFGYRAISITIPPSRPETSPP